MSQEGWFIDPDNPYRLRYKDENGWTRKIKNLPGAEHQYESELPPLLKRGHVTLDSSAINDSGQYGHYLAATVDGRTLQNSTPISGGNGFKKFFVAVVVIIAAIALFNSCQPSGWRMGVDGNGYQVTCRDGSISMSGGIQGACSQHGGVQ